MKRLGGLHWNLNSKAQPGGESVTPSPWAVTHSPSCAKIRALSLRLEVHVALRAFARRALHNLWMVRARVLGSGGIGTGLFAAGDERGRAGERQCCEKNDE